MLLAINILWRVSFSLAVRFINETEE